MKKRVLLMMTALSMATSVFTCGCGASKENVNDAASKTKAEVSKKDEATDKVVMKIYTTGQVPSNMDSIMKEVNTLTKRDLNMALDLEIMDKDTYENQLPLMLSSGEEIDIAMSTGKGAVNYVNQGYMTDISEFIDSDGQGIIDSFNGDKDTAKVCGIGDVIFGVPLHKDSCHQQTVFMRKDIVDKYNINVDDIHSLKDLNDTFEIVSKGEPDMWMLTVSSSASTATLCGGFGFDGLTDGFGELIDIDSSKVTNAWESDAFKNYCGQMREWYTKGWINPGAASDKESYYNYIKSGQAFACIRRYGHPLAKSDCEAACGGTELVTATLSDPYETTTTAYDVCYTVPYTSKDPQKAVQMISYLMNSKEINNLLNWGIEGEDYVVTESGNATFPTGKDESNVNYHLNSGWSLPNQFIAYPWDTMDADIYDKMQKYNESAKKSIAYGFTYDASEVTTQVTAVKNVESKYLVPLITGSVDPNEYIKKLNDEAYAAGLQEIIDVKQQQLDKWLEAKEK